MNYTNSSENKQEINNCISTNHKAQISNNIHDDSSLNYKECKIVPLYPEYKKETKQNHLLVSHKAKSDPVHNQRLKNKFNQVVPWTFIIIGSILLMLALIIKDSSSELLKALCIIFYLIALHTSQRT